jgi:hypothetical protein
MSWPSGSKASNQYTDQDTDLISDARADINQTILNVNSIIDTFDIESPSNGDLLQYNSTTSKWEPVNTSAISTQKIAVLTALSRIDLGSAFNPRYAVGWTDISDIYNIVTYDDTTNNLTLQAGSYLFERELGAGPTSPDNFGFYEDDVLIGTIYPISAEGDAGDTFMFVRTITEPTNYRLRQSSTNTFDWILKITKL